MMDKTSESELLDSVRARLPDLKALLEKSSSHWGYEDPIYRFYHHSLKVFALQSQTEQIASALSELLPSHPLNNRILKIVGDGTGKEFSPDMNATWERQTRPILEAFLPRALLPGNGRPLRGSSQPSRPAPERMGGAPLPLQTQVIRTPGPPRSDRGTI